MVPHDHGEASSDRNSAESQFTVQTSRLGLDDGTAHHISSNSSRGHKLGGHKPNEGYSAPACLFHWMYRTKSLNQRQKVSL